MLSVMLLRVGSEVMHSVLGGMAVFCLYYAGQVANPNLVKVLMIDALKWGISAALIVYFKIKYLES